MAIELNSEISNRFLKARQELKLTQLELEAKARVSLRTIKDLESGRRTSFNEDTLIRLCRALNLDYSELLGNAIRRSKRRAMIVTVIAGLVLVVMTAGYFIFMRNESEVNRIDWVSSGEKLQISHFNPDWGGKDGRNVNYFHLDTRTPKIGDTVLVDLKWSWYCMEGSTPLYYINAFTEWEPDREISLFEGVISGEGSDTLYFDFTCPKKPDIYKIRVFFASSFGPVSSYYGHPAPNQLSTPSSAPFIEIPVEVIEK